MTQWCMHDRSVPDAASEVESVPEHVHREADQRGVGDHGGDGQELEDRHPSTDVLSTGRRGALVEL